MKYVAYVVFDKNMDHLVGKTIERKFALDDKKEKVEIVVGKYYSNFKIDNKFYYAYLVDALKFIPTMIKERLNNRKGKIPFWTETINFIGDEGESALIIVFIDSNIKLNKLS